MRTIVEKAKIGGTIILVHKDKNGRVIGKRELKNIVTATGKAAVAGLVNNADSQNAFTVLALGTGTATAVTTDTAIGTELVANGFLRAAATLSRVTSDDANDTAQLVHEWTSASADTVAVTECGAFNATAVPDSGGVMLGRQVFAAVNMATADKLEVTYKFDID